MPRLLAATAVGLVLAVAGIAGVAIANPPVPVATTAAVPAKVDPFRLVDAVGRAHDLYRLKDATAVVLVMHGADVSKTGAELEKLKAAYGDKGVEFFMLNSTLGADRDKVAAEARKIGLTVPVLMDDQQLVGEQLGATRSSEAFVLNPKTWAVAYHGAVSDGKKAYLADALEAAVNGKPVTLAAVPAKGSTIAFPNRTPAAKAAFQKISYVKDIAPILEAKCVACHEKGGIGPFAMTSYEVVKGFAPMIRESVRTDRMPPWDVDAHVGSFKDDKSLSADQIKTLVHWVEAGAPRGEGVDPLAANPREAPEWPLGKPDVIVDIPSYQIPVSGVVDYQYPTVANPLTEGKWLKASTTKVDQRQAVHHVLSGFIKPGQTQKGMMAWGSSVGGYTVGMESVVNPKGMGTWMPAGGEYGFQMHYTPFGKAVTANTKVGLYFYKDGEKPDLVMREAPLVNQFIKIPPNDGNHVETAYFLFPKDALLYTSVVHAHYRGTYSKLEIQYPNGERKTILNVPFYDFNWQRMYEYEKPISIPAGSKVIATYIYDNSKRNPANPDPSKEVVWGDQSFEEMFYTSLRYRWMDETAANQTNYDELLNNTRLMGMMDSNIDGKLQKTEFRGQFAQLLAAPGRFEMIDKNKDGGIDQEELDAAMKMMRAMAPRKPDAAAPTAGR
jgi:hypothetical protein